MQDVGGYEDGTDSIAKSDYKCALQRCQRELFSFATLLIHLNEETIGVDNNGTDTRLLIEHIDEEADPGTFGILGATDSFLEAC